MRLRIEFDPNINKYVIFYGEEYRECFKKKFRWYSYPKRRLGINSARALYDTLEEAEVMVKQIKYGTRDLYGKFKNDVIKEY